MTVAPSQHARRHATAALTALVAAGFLLTYTRSLAFAGLFAWGFFALLLYAFVSCSAWAFTAWRSRKPDPWAYDADLDGPIAQEFEGRTFPPSTSRTPAPRGSTALWLAMSVAFLLAGVWLAGIASGIYGNGHGAEAPSLTALMLYLGAACFLAAGPWVAWRALGARRARP